MRCITILSNDTIYREYIFETQRRRDSEDKNDFIDDRVDYLLVACSSENDTLESQELNASETEKDTEIVSVEASFEYYTFNEAIHNADLIAEIQIKNMVKEIEDPIEKTIFEVKVLDVIVGNDERKLI